MPDRWFDTNFVKRRKLTFDNSGQNEALLNFPILVKLNSSRITYSSLQANGEDLRFVDQGHLVQIDHEIEKWDSSGESFVWVKIPLIDLARECDHCYMYYDNPSAADGQAIASLWSDFPGVWHLKENPSDSAPQYLNSAKNSKDGTRNNSLILNQIIINGSQKFVFNGGAPDFAVDGWIDIVNDSAFNQFPMTIDISFHWTNTSGTSAAGIDMIERNFTALPGWFVYQALGDSNNSKLKLKYAVDNSNKVLLTTGLISHNTVHHAQIVVTSSGMIVYVDGSQFATASWIGTPSVITSNFDLAFGKGRNVSNIGSYNDTLDEVRICKIARSSDWAKASNLTLTDKFITFGKEENLDGQIRLPITTDENSRRSIPQFFLRTVPPKPDGTIGVRARRHVAWLYSRPGIVGTFTGKIIEKI